MRKRPLLFFFFSSRRRHTSSKRDWSSDVCSSDLLEHVAADLLGKIFAGENVRGVGPVGHGERILAGLVGIGLLDPAVFQKPVDDVIAALDRTLAVAHR